MTTERNPQATAPRTPWPEGFPAVVVHAVLAERDQHPLYVKAKAGEFQAALGLVADLVKADALDRLRAILGNRRPFVAAVTAIEASGFNAIPDAMAHAIGSRLGLPLDAGELRQINTVGHTRATGWHRIVTPPVFAGGVTAGADYVLIDDHIGLGGTLANLRGYVESNDGRVVAMSTLTQSRDAATIALTPATLSVRRSKHGSELETLWREIYGHGLDCLTEVEGGYVARSPTVDAIARCLVEAAEKAAGSGLSTIAVPRLEP